MKRISSKRTFFYKRVFPVLWFGFLAFFVLVSSMAGRRTHAAPIPMLIVPVVMAVFGYMLFRRLIFDLVDEVWDDGDELVVKNAGVEERVPLRNIVNIGYSLLTNPERVTLTLREVGPFGKEVTFVPLRRPFSFRWLSRNPIIDELIERVDQARRRASVNERNTSVTCSTCGALSGPRGVNGLIVRSWVCRDCGELHERDVNAARNILIGSRYRTSVGGNEQSPWLIPPSNAYRVREAGIESAWAAA